MEGRSRLPVQIREAAETIGKSSLRRSGLKVELVLVKCSDRDCNANTA